MSQVSFVMFLLTFKINYQCQFYIATCNYCTVRDGLVPGISREAWGRVLTSDEYVHVAPGKISVG